MQLENQSVLITGGASGLGAATARLLGSRGARITLLDRNVTEAERIVHELGGLALACDVTDAASVENAIAHAKKIQGPPRVCVNCAGIAPGKRILGKEGPMPLQEFKQVIDINLIGTFNVMRIAAQHMYDAPLLGEERGVIINTASIAAYEGQIGQAAYSASKGGVVSLTLPAARELAAWCIRVVTIAPGLFDTPMMQHVSDKVKENLSHSFVFPTRLGKAEEYAKLVLHIVENVMLNGAVIRLDAGVRMSS